MNGMLSIALQLGESRANSPDATSGVLIIVGIVTALVLLAFIGHWLVDRFGGTKRKSLERDPQRPGRVGRVGKQEGP